MHPVLLGTLSSSILADRQSWYRVANVTLVTLSEKHKWGQISGVGVTLQLVAVARSLIPQNVNSFWGINAFLLTPHV